MPLVGGRLASDFACHSIKFARLWAAIAIANFLLFLKGVVWQIVDLHVRGFYSLKMATLAWERVSEIFRRFLSSLD